MNRYLLLLPLLALCACQAAQGIATNLGDGLQTMVNGAPELAPLLGDVASGLIGFGSTGDLGVGASALIAGQAIWNKLKASGPGQVIGPGAATT